MDELFHKTDCSRWIYYASSTMTDFSFLLRLRGVSATVIIYSFEIDVSTTTTQAYACVTATYITLYNHIACEIRSITYRLDFHEPWRNAYINYCWIDRSLIIN